jgi:hypothetical protein
MEDNLNFLVNGICPQFITIVGQVLINWKATSIPSKWKTTSFFWQMEDDLNILVNGRQPFCKWKQSQLFVNRRRLHIFNTGNTKAKLASGKNSLS